VRLEEWQTYLKGEFLDGGDETEATSFTVASVASAAAESADQGKTRLHPIMFDASGTVSVPSTRHLADSSSIDEEQAEIADALAELATQGDDWRPNGSIFAVPQVIDSTTVTLQASVVDRVSSPAITPEVDTSFTVSHAPALETVDFLCGDNAKSEGIIDLNQSSSPIILDAELSPRAAGPFTLFMPITTLPSASASAASNKTSQEKPKAVASEETRRGAKRKSRAVRPSASFAVAGVSAPKAKNFSALEIPRYVKTLLSLVNEDSAREIAQSSYKRPFGETRQELIARLLDPVLSLEETARILNVCPATVRRYTNRGLLNHYRKDTDTKFAPQQGAKDTRQRRFRLSDVIAFLEEHEAASGRSHGRVTASRELMPGVDHEPWQIGAKYPDGTMDPKRAL